jgi:hypothetical protein
MSSCFEEFSDAVFEANFRAAITRRRYRVRFDVPNRLWHLYETVTVIE